MNRTFCITWVAASSLLIALFSAGCGGKADPGDTTWTDPEGDAQPFANKPDWPRPDIVTVAARGENGVLRLACTLSPGRLKAMYNYTHEDGAKAGDSVVEYYIDADNDSQTGGKPTWWQEADRPLEGYELHADVMTGFLCRNKQSGMTNRYAGGMVVKSDEYEIIDTTATYMLWPMEKAQLPFAELDYQEKTKAIDQATTVEGDTIAITIPYKWLGLQAGDEIRVCFKETAQGGASGKGFSEDKTILLK